MVGRRARGLLVTILLVALAACGRQAGGPAVPELAVPELAAHEPAVPEPAWTVTPAAGRTTATATLNPAAWPTTGAGVTADPTPPPANTTGAAPASPSPACRLFVLAGQSNMAGRGRYGALPAGDDGSLPANVQLVAVTLDVHGRPLGGGFGPELGLARTLAPALPGERLLLAKYAVEGSSLLDWGPHWDAEAAALTGHPEFGSLYRELLALVARATAEEGAGAGCRPAAVLWMQGERDALFPEAAAAYEANLAALIQALRADLGVPGLPFLVGQVDPPVDRYRAAATVRAAQAAAAATLPGVYLVDTQGLARHADGVHYDTAGQLELGRRFAQVYLGIP